MPSRSAFYSGATRYGGSSAIAKRSQAAKRSFFNVEIPKSTTSSSYSSIQTFTVNVHDKRQEQPALTAVAKKIYDWIQENSPQDVNLTKKPKMIANRFNPMAYTRRPTKPAINPNPYLAPPPIQAAPPKEPPKLIAPVKLTPMDPGQVEVEKHEQPKKADVPLIPKPKLDPLKEKPLPIPTPPRSSRFIAPKTDAPKSPIIEEQIQNKCFKPPIDRMPPKQSEQPKIDKSKDQSAISTEAKETHNSIHANGLPKPNLKRKSEDVGLSYDHMADVEKSPKPAKSPLLSFTPHPKPTVQQDYQEALVWP